MEYRAYFFTNMYISDIQRGIQTAHCISDMHTKYQLESNDCSKILNKWSEYDKTMIVLNGGYSSHLKDIMSIFDDQNELPWDSFYESMEALDGTLTCVGIIIPEYIYETAKMFKDMTEEGQNTLLSNDNINFNEKSYKNTFIISWLIENLSNYRLA